jgi:hypothetical protein
VSPPFEPNNIYPIQQANNKSILNSSTETYLYF